jgi:hypothetical protein
MQTPETPGSHNPDATFLSLAVEWLLLLAERAAVASGSSTWTAHRENQLQQSFSRLQSARSEDVSFVLLSQKLQLTLFEQMLLLLAVCNELSTRFAEIFSRLPESPGSFLTLAAVKACFPSIFSWHDVDPDGPLRRLHLIELTPVSGRIQLLFPLRADERVMTFVRGSTAIDDRLSHWLRPVRTTMRRPLAESLQRVSNQLATQMRLSSELPQLPLAQLVGADPASRQLVATQLAQDLDCCLYLLHADALPDSPADLELFLRIWERESRLLPLALLIEADELDSPGSTRDVASETVSSRHGLSRTIQRICSLTDRLVILSVRDRWALPAIGRDAISVDIPVATPTEQQQEWKNEFLRSVVPTVTAPFAAGPTLNHATVAPDDLFENTSQQLAFQFNFPIASIRSITGRCPPPTFPAGETAIEEWCQQLREACRAETRPRLLNLASRVIPRARWEELILPEKTRQQLQQIRFQMQNRSLCIRRWGLEERFSRGLGLTVLFAGASGTGKTMAAEVLARELDLDLFVVDLSSLVSKYIGETQKHIRAVFDAGECGTNLICMHEVDAVAAKRGLGSSDAAKFASQDVCYLLQRMEDYRGLAVLTTNRRADLDDAFQRRLRYVVDFPLPDEAQRADIWRTLLPPQSDGPSRNQGIPVGELDYNSLSRFQISGGTAFNAAINAAFLAAEDQIPVQNKHVKQAIRSELVKLSQPFTEADFDDQANQNSTAPMSLNSVALRLREVNQKIKTGSGTN